MSEFTNHKAERVNKLCELFQIVISGKLTPELVAEYQMVIDLTQPSDVIAVVDRLVQLQIPMPELKKGINKSLNLLNKSLQEFRYQAPEQGSFLHVLCQNNVQIDMRLKAIRPLISMLNQGNQQITEQLRSGFTELSLIDLHYQIKENVLFPLIEKNLPGHRCLKVMWSFHDDIRRNLKEIIYLLNEKNFELKKINRLAGDIFFNIYAIKFREERILFPVISGIIPEEELNSLLSDSLEIGFPFVHPEITSGEEMRRKSALPEDVDLNTGFMTPEQIELVFNHLPVDITYVDENNKVRYYSTPEKRIFRRTKSIIGRDVKNCHPHESVHVVEQIVEAFRKGEKDKASFWIRMKGEFILIQYFAVRDKNGKYRGVVEVSQEISEIRNIQGENRLLDWTN
jgi:DUF438 domain-containing protein